MVGGCNNGVGGGWSHRISGGDDNGVDGGDDGSNGGWDEGLKATKVTSNDNIVVVATRIVVPATIMVVRRNCMK